MSGALAMMVLGAPMPRLSLRLLTARVRKRIELITSRVA
jgi:hypothetical protein